MLKRLHVSAEQTAGPVTPRKYETIIQEWVVDVKPTGQGTAVSLRCYNGTFFFSFYFLLKGREAIPGRLTESPNEPEWSDGFGKRKKGKGGKGEAGDAEEVKECEWRVSESAQET